MTNGPIAHTVDPDGREIVYDERARDHIERRRPNLIDQVDAIITAITQPDHREDDPLLGRERFCAPQITDKVRWLRVVVDFNETPAFVVTALIQRKNPTRDR